MGRVTLRRLALAAGLALVADVHLAHADFWSATGNAIETDAHETGNAIKRVARHVGNAVETGAHRTGNAIKNAAHKAGNAIGKGARDTGHQIKKTVRNTRKPPTTQGPKYSGLTST
jgi:type IV secretory pathway TrbL component